MFVSGLRATALRRLTTLAILSLPAFATDVRVHVFTLFHPTVIEVVPLRDHPLLIGDERVAWPDRRRMRTGGIRVRGLDEQSTDFIVSVPSRITRQFHGVLEIVKRGPELVPVLTMDLELAVASIVAAESPPGAQFEAQKAQAVVARSFLLAAGKRHPEADFCDTTHCQFLRSPPQDQRAATSTAGLVLMYEGRIIEALYSANCGGSTRTLAQARLRVTSYPYFSVDCPERTFPDGHRVGLCQRGAAAMARKGADFRTILRHYFPATSVDDRVKSGS